MKRKLSYLLRNVKSKIESISYLRCLSTVFLQHDLWHINHRSVTKGAFIGLFWSMIPIPFQTIPVVLSSIIARANIPVSAVLVWVTNPITIPPIFYLNYKIGTIILGQKPKVPDNWSIDGMIKFLGEALPPSIMGSLASGISVGIIGAIIVQVIWRIYLIRARQKNKS